MGLYLLARLWRTSVGKNQGFGQQVRGVHEEVVFCTLRGVVPVMLGEPLRAFARDGVCGGRAANLVIAALLSSDNLAAAKKRKKQGHQKCFQQNADVGRSKKQCLRLAQGSLRVKKTM